MEENKTPKILEDRGQATTVSDEAGRQLAPAEDQSKSILADIAFYLMTAGSALAGSFTYQMEARLQDGVGMDRDALRKRAIKRIKGLLLDEFCDCLERESAIRQLHLSKDQIRLLSEQFLENEILEEKFEGNNYFLKARLVADPARYADSSATLSQLDLKTKELEAARKRVDAALADVERLEEEVRFARMRRHVVEALALEPPIVTHPQDEPLKAPLQDLAAGLGDGQPLEGAKPVVPSPADATPFLESGSSHSLSGEYEEAIRDFTHALEVDPQSARAFSQRGSALAALARFDEALEDFSEAIARGEDMAEAYFSRGILFLANRNDPEKAIADLGKVIGLTPDDLKAYLCRGAAYERLGLYKESISDFSKAADLAQRDSAPLFNRGNVYLRSGDTEKAIADYSEALRRNPEHAGALFNRAFGYARLGEFEKALGDFTAVIALDPADPKAVLYRGHVHYRLGRHADAIEDWQKAASFGEETALKFLAQVRA